MWNRICSARDSHAAGHSTRLVSKGSQSTVERRHVCLDVLRRLCLEFECGPAIAREDTLVNTMLPRCPHALPLHYCLHMWSINQKQCTRRMPLHPTDKAQMYAISASHH